MSGGTGDGAGHPGAGAGAGAGASQDPSDEEPTVRNDVVRADAPPPPAYPAQPPTAHPAPADAPHTAGGPAAPHPASAHPAGAPGAVPHGGGPGAPGPHGGGQPGGPRSAPPAGHAPGPAGHAPASPARDGHRAPEPPTHRGPAVPAPRGTTDRPPRDDAAAARARALVVPVAEPGPRAPATPDPVAPVLPGRPNAARPQVRRPAGRVEESGAVCPWCSTGNRPDRHFCRRCAMSLADGSDGPGGRRPWWRRLFAGRNEVRWAGERPRLRRGLAWLLPLIGWGLVAALVITAVFMAPAAIQAVKDHFAKRAPVSPDTYAASRSYADNGPELAFDKFSNTFWGPGITGDGAGEWIEARFAQPVDTLEVLITPGVSARSNDLAKSARPSRLEALITTADGKKETRTLTLDQGTRQQRPLRARDVVSVRFTVVSSFGAGADKQVAIAEIEFFGPSGSYSRR
ncbi:NADase-type glycan-binding domain-containing protein [Streptomyces xinghaiensis]|uniref:Zinc ribbon domain-containing protein n=2 Tax=Streptomyces TaxID=1883 RepID=A0A3M8F6A9_9ACTN|nr:hypothetical protein [Streptomyces xinghaiensis]PQM22959.1 hypothetical protein Sfr7A_14945 [Streptomyces xinghaiensis]RKM97433.1 zinc ribbon domain-containing protein [Streptomyces xinghaiensis]RNC73733.1 zinc ribbon domain-containing protein [Streptomyces xinghaiensis]